MKKKLIGCTLDKLKAIVSDYSLPGFTAEQIADWIYKKRVNSLDMMTNISKTVRSRLAEDYVVGVDSPVETAISSDGTKKYVFPSHTGTFIETVMIPEKDRSTLCVSSQAGCKMGCKFCMTGRQGFHGNLDTAEIISQFLGIEERDSITNAVFMGMGEPLDNLSNVLESLDILTAQWGFAWSPKRITLSSIGVMPALETFLHSSKVHVAISLHNPFPEEREKLMPAQKAFPINKVVEILRNFDFSGQRRVSFEYIMFEGVNDSMRYADEIIRLLKGIQCRINLIRFHSIPDFPLRPSSSETMRRFESRLNSMGIVSTVRASRGEDIFAACGLLSGKRNIEGPGS